MIIDSIEELWNTSIDEYMCAGVQDLMPSVYKEIIGLNKDDFYINSGVLIINLKKWREKNVEEDFYYAMKKYEKIPIHQDQGIINATLRC